MGYEVAALLCGIIGGVIQLVIAVAGLVFGGFVDSFGGGGIAGASPADSFLGMKPNQR